MRRSCTVSTRWRWRRAPTGRHNHPVPELPPTLAALRPSAGSGEDPVHRRTITMEVFRRGEYLAVVGTLHDERPWAGGDYGPRDLHVMDLGLVVRVADMTIVDAAA